MIVMQYGYACIVGGRSLAAACSGTRRSCVSRGVHHKQQSRGHRIPPSDTASRGGRHGRVQFAGARGAWPGSRRRQASSRHHLDRGRALAHGARSPGAVALLAEGRARHPGGAPNGDDHCARSLAESRGHHLGGERRYRQYAAAARLPSHARLNQWLRGRFLPAVALRMRAPGIQCWTAQRIGAGGRRPPVRAGTLTGTA